MHTLIAIELGRARAESLARPRGRIRREDAPAAGCGCELAASPASLATRLSIAQPRELTPEHAACA
jgi:hypothetical protein